MSIRLRRVLMWLLLLALPMQGYAAATMLNCGANHHRAAAGTAVTSATNPSADLEHHHADEADHADHADHATLGGHAHADGVSKSKCSACAACCVAAALPAAALVFASAAPDGAPTRVFAIGPIGFLTGGPDRPPRTLLV